MDVVRMPKGEPAPVDGDCVIIQTLADGRFGLGGTALCGVESVALIGYPPFDDAAAAEEAGLAWAQAQGVATIHIVIDPVTISSD